MTTSCDKLWQNILEGNYKIEINGKEYFNGNIIRHYTIADLSGKEGSDSLYLYCFDELEGFRPEFFLRIPKVDRYKEKTYSIQTRADAGEHIFDFAMDVVGTCYVATEGWFYIRSISSNNSREDKVFSYDITVVEIDRETNELVPDGEQLKIHGEAKMDFSIKPWDDFVKDTQYNGGLFGRILSYRILSYL